MFEANEISSSKCQIAEICFKVYTYVYVQVEFLFPSSNLSY